ncbi:MAG: cell division protein FtsQ/DivIB [Persicimonas sp.]
MFGFRTKNRRKRPLGERLKDALGRLADYGKKILPIAALLLVAVAIPFAVFHAYMRVVSGTYFELDEIEVSGVEYADGDALLEDAGLIEGLNAFDVDVDRAEEAIEADPWVERARVERRLPDRVAVSVEEYRPAGVLVDDGYQLVDADGDFVKEIEADDPVDELLERPLITGLSVEELDEKSSRDSYLDALEVVESYRDRGLSEWDHISEVHVDAVSGLTVMTASKGIEIRLGQGRYQERLDRLEAVQESIAERSMQVDYILIDRESDLSRVAVGRHDGPGKAEDGRAVGQDDDRDKKRKAQ